MKIVANKTAEKYEQSKKFKMSLQRKISAKNKYIY